MTIRISDDWAAMPAPLTDLLRLNQYQAGLHAYLEHDTVYLEHWARPAWNRIQETPIAHWPVAEFSVPVLRAAADRWLAEQKVKVA